MEHSEDPLTAFTTSGFTYADARASGVGRSRLRGRDLQRPFRGVRTIGVDLSSQHDLCRAYAARMREGEYFSHESSAVLHGLPIPSVRDPRSVHVSVFAPRKPPKMRGVISHELTPAGHRVTAVDGLPCISPEDTWAQLSGRLDVPGLVAIGDFLVTGDEPYSGIRSSLDRIDLERALRHHGRSRGVRNLRLALELVRYGSLSPQESRLRVAMVQGGLPEPELNFRVLDEGRFIAMVDLAYPRRRLAIEYLGDHHRTDRVVFQSDIRRRERLAEAGWNALYITSSELSGPAPGAVSHIRRALARSTPNLRT